MTTFEALPVNDEYDHLKQQLLTPWSYPREIDDQILHDCVDNNLKSDIVFELRPDLVPSYYSLDNIYRYSIMERILSGPIEVMRENLLAVNQAQQIYEDIRDKYKAVPPIREVRDLNGWVHEFAICNIIIKNELRQQIASIDPARVDEIASAYWGYAHTLKYAGELDW